MIDKATAKLADEKKTFKGGSYAKAMCKDVYDTLINFCKQDDEFAQAVYQNDKTLSDCLDYVAKGVTGNSIKDIDAYKRAVEFYFKGADIRCTMTIDLCGGVVANQTEQVEDKPKSALTLSLDDLF